MPYSHLTNDELIALVYLHDTPDPLLLEIAHRLEHGFPNELEVPE